MQGTSSHSQSLNGVLVIQYNWEENLRENENVWVYFKPLNEKSYHGNIGDNTFEILDKKNKAISIRYLPLNIQNNFVCPYKTLTDIHSKSVISLDVADGGLGVSTCTGNKLLVWETRDGSVRRNLEGHVFDVYKCKLFPSGIVVLSGGADMQLKIWDAATGHCPVTLKGHTASVTDFSIVERGKNIISVSKDGTARLWNCSQAKGLNVLVEGESEINCCDIIHVGNEIDIPDAMETTDELEFGTEGKLLAIGCEVGKVIIMSVSARTILATHLTSSPVLSLCWLPNYFLILGLEDGRVMAVDCKKITEVPQLLCHDSASSILCVKPLKSGFVLGRRDGLCQFYTFDGTSKVQLTGSNCDPIYDVSVDSNFVYTACRDKTIRKYRIADMNI
ncbi:UNVERIFIED_CONTAM: hypothetical protein RMT77_015618 [Armadillidium vulgare]